LDFLWIIIFVLFMMYRAFQESQKKQAEAQRRRQVLVQKYEKPKQEVPWDFEPWDAKDVTVQEYKPKYEDTWNVPAQENPYIDLHKLQRRKEKVKKAKDVYGIEDAVEDISVNIADSDSINEYNVSPRLTLSFDSSSMASAVIMSEILQPPRAKRPIR